MPRKLLKVDFYTVEMPKNSGMMFNDILLSIAASPDNEERWVRIKHHPVGLQSASSRNNVIEGDLVRLRMGDGAMKGRTADVKLEEIALQDDEALAERTAFLFHIPTATLLIERNYVGVSASTMAQYCEAKTSISPIIMSPLLQEEAFKKLDILRKVRTFSFRVSGVKDASFLRESGWSGAQVLDIMNKFQSPSIEINLSMSRQRKGTLNIKNTLQAAKNLYKSLSSTETPVTKLVITGATDDDEKRVLDLIEDCIREERWIEYATRMPSYEVRRQGVLEAWLKRKDEVMRLRSQGG